ncbi:restriction endonuclease subunit S [Pseudomonas syringae]|uniref:restriction endonuclease subunit S n=1 Tax=Pseudomonas syringae TaxID=317 RepID=UPI0004E6482C|nr:restriction endonuclease subunit S [Pseudomonas syringae]KFF81762.1 restriction endonuclease [Pseudomonas syringae pv. syringae]
MTALLIDNLPLLAGAPNGIKKLRELILELAVRGKLVPQDPSDEPASKLLKRIAEEKARLVAEGKIKKQKPLAEVGEEAVPFELPAGWKWSSLAQVAFVNPRNAAADSLEVSFVPMTFIGTRFDDQHGQEPRLWGEVKQGFTHFAEGDIGVAKITPCFENSKACVFSNLMNGLGAGTTELHIVRPANGTLDPRYVLAYLKSPQFLLVGETKMTGTAGQKRLPKDFVEANPFPLPPLAEQHRIVAKVDELMALCDRLETQQIDAGNAHAQLVQALLDSLTQASDATDFASNWQRLAEHFHTLFTTEPSIDALKQTLLQLAVMGKLVLQDPSDEPASELLKRIAVEKARLVAEGKLKKQKPQAEITDPEAPFGLPSNWTWSRIGDLALSTEYGLSEKTSDLQNGVPVLKMGDIQNGQVMLGGQMKVSKATEGLPELYLEPEDLLYNRTNSAELVGKTGLFLGRADEFTFASYLIRIRCLKSLFSPSYLNISMNAPRFRETQITPHLKQQCGQANVNGTIMKNMMISAPPIAEQHRIVAKVNQLMDLCNQLKIRLTQTRQLNEQLANTLIERALAEDGQQTPIATHQQTARTLLAAEVTHRLHSQRTFGQRKLQKVIYLAEHAAKLSAIQGDYLRDAAGPHDRQLMNKVEGEMQNHQWYERIERETVGHAYRPLSQAGQHRQAYSSAWSVAERVTIEQVIELMRDWDTDRCEMTVTLYAAWNDFILEGRPVSDEAIVDEVMHSWNDTKLRFGKTEWLAVLAEMKKHKILMPTGFGKRTTGGMLSLPGFE